MHIPSESGEFHDEHHLGGRDLHGLVTETEKGSDDMAMRILFSETAGCREKVHAYLANRCDITKLQATVVSERVSILKQRGHT